MEDGGIGFVIPELTLENSRLQPWHYSYNMLTALSSLGTQVTLITNLLNENDLPMLDSNIALEMLPQKRLAARSNRRRLNEIVSERKLETIVWPTSKLTVQYKGLLKQMKCRRIGLVLGTVYDFSDILNTSCLPILSDFQQTSTYFIEALIPGAFFSDYVSTGLFEKLVVISSSNLQRLLDLGFPQDRVAFVPPGVSKDLMDQSKRAERIRSDFREKMTIKSEERVILYLGPPSPVRGVHSLIEAFATMKPLKGFRLVLLLRQNSKEFSTRVRQIRDMVRKKRIQPFVSIISKRINQRDVLGYIASADIVALPFILVQSEVPLTVIEAMAFGRLVITGSGGGLDSILSEGRGVVLRRCTPHSLASALAEILSTPHFLETTGRKAADFFANQPTWNQSAERFLKVINGVSGSND